MSELVQTETIQVITVPADTTQIVEAGVNETVSVVERFAEIISVAEQGPPGPSNDPLALHISQRLAEFDTQQSKTEARVNLELEYIDGGTFN